MGSARGDSNTLKAIGKLCPFENYDLLDLRQLAIRPYSYLPAETKNDDFLSAAIRMQEAEVIIFASPIYWYSMSGLMKVFFDRFTDLLTTHKSIGRSLKGKKVYVIAQGSDTHLPEGFEVPFRKTCEYFEMEFLETFYLNAREIVN